MRPTACETLDIPYNSLVFKDTQDKVLRFSKTNYTSAEFSILARTDNGTEVARSTCNFGNVTE